MQSRHGALGRCAYYAARSGRAQRFSDVKARRVPRAVQVDGTAFAVRSTTRCQFPSALRGAIAAAPDHHFSRNRVPLAPRERKVVYAEDDEMFRSAVTEMLTSAGVDVYCCRDGIEAVELCSRLRPDAALFD